MSENQINICANCNNCHDCQVCPKNQFLYGTVKKEQRGRLEKRPLYNVVKEVIDECDFVELLRYGWAPPDEYDNEVELIYYSISENSTVEFITEVTKNVWSKMFKKPIATIEQYREAAEKIKNRIDNGEYISKCAGEVKLYKALIFKRPKTAQKDYDRYYVSEIESYVFIWSFIHNTKTNQGAPGTKNHRHVRDTLPAEIVNGEQYDLLLDVDDDGTYLHDRYGTPQDIQDYVLKEFKSGNTNM